ncbi:MAG TPA: terminase [Chloroflexi bacterium]|nr:terminase [Chloroflexota bacterium]
MWGSRQMNGGIDRTTVYKPLPWQIAPLRDTSPVILLTGAAGGGKSRIAAEKIHGYMMRYPGATGLMLRKAREFCNKSIVPFFNKTVIGKTSGVTFKKSDYLFEYSNGSVLYFGGVRDDQQREAIRSIGQDGALDIVWIEEANAFTIADFEELIARMRGNAASWRQIILTTNPDSPYHWINQELILKGNAAVYYSNWRENPHNPPSYAKMLDRLTGIRRKRLRDGLWVQAEGAIYEFDPSIHVIGTFPIPDDWRRFRAIDFGYTNPFVCQWWAIDPDGRMYLYREIYMSRRTVEKHSRQINALSAEEHIEETICDHDAEDRATLAENGIHNIAALKDVQTGLQAVMERLRVQPDGKPRLMVMRGCTVEIDYSLKEGDPPKPTSTEEEFPGYVWEQPKAGKEDRDRPLKLNDHGMDTARYAVMYADAPQAVTLSAVRRSVF